MTISEPSVSRGGASATKFIMHVCIQSAPRESLLAEAVYFLVFNSYPFHGPCNSCTATVSIPLHTHLRSMQEKVPTVLD